MNTADDRKSGRKLGGASRGKVRLTLAILTVALTALAATQIIGDRAEREDWCTAYRASYEKFPDTRLAALRAEYLTGLRLSADSCD